MARAIACVLAVVLAAASVGAQAPRIPAISVIPQRLPDPPRANFVQDRADLVMRGRNINTAIRAYNARCAGAAESTSGCKGEQAKVGADTAALVSSINEFNKALTDAMVSGLVRFLRDSADYRKRRPDTGGAPGRPIEPGDVPSVTRSRDAVFIGGTGWVYGYVRRNDPKLEQVARADFKGEKNLAGIEGFMTVDDYDMVMGIAGNHSFFFDLVDRVVGVPFSTSDQTSLGAFSAEAQPLYASLKGVRTPKLDCHSNGAMICLRALTMGDIGPAVDAAGKKRLDVRLFGPQITRAALDQWRALLNGTNGAGGTITSLEININVGDPIAPASLAIGEERWAGAAMLLAKTFAPLANGQLKVDVSQLDFFSPAAADRTQSVIQQRIPNARVRVGVDTGCLRNLVTNAIGLDPNSISACHDMRVYQVTTR